MGCVKIENGFVCAEDDFVDLAPFGAFVWMSWHHYHGPTFYRSKNAIKAIENPSGKTWKAFGKWRKENSK